MNAPVSHTCERDPSYLETHDESTHYALVIYSTQASNLVCIISCLQLVPANTSELSSLQKTKEKEWKDGKEEQTDKDRQVAADRWQQHTVDLSIICCIA